MIRPLNRRLAMVLLLGWALLYDRGGRGWETLDVMPTSWTCDRLRTARIDEEVQREIGGALANQNVDNPMRVDAYRKAAAHVVGRYRCESVR